MDEEWSCSCFTLINISKFFFSYLFVHLQAVVDSGAEVMGVEAEGESVVEGVETVALEVASAKDVVEDVALEVEGVEAEVVVVVEE